jgi:uncharacterized membrane protein YczE
MIKMKRVARRSVRWLAFSRQGVIGAARTVYGSRVVSPARSIVYLLAASTLIGAGVTMFRRADLGVPPYDVLMSAIDRHTQLTHGQASWAFSGAMMLLAAILGSRLKLASVTYIVMTGLMVDATYGLVGDPASDVARVAFVVAGVFAITAGVATVVHTTAGGGGFEMLGQVAARRGRSPRAFRTALEVSVLAAGAVAGGDFGFGTVVFALTIGPLLDIVLRALADHRIGRDLRQAVGSETHALEHLEQLVG